MKNIILICVVIVAIVSACGRSSEIADVPDVTRPTVLVLNSRSANVSGITLHIHGQIDGDAVFSTSGWETQRLSGKVDYKIYHDWFQPKCNLHYQPQKVTSGVLTVEYKFH